MNLIKFRWIWTVIIKQDLYLTLGTLTLMRYYYNQKFRVLGDLNNEWISFAARFCIPEDNTRERKKSYSDTNFRKSSVKKWLQILPALNISLPLASRFSAVFRVISLYSTTWYLPSTLQTTPTASVGNAFSTTCKNMKNLYT